MLYVAPTSKWRIVSRDTTEGYYLSEGLTFDSKEDALFYARARNEEQ